MELKLAALRRALTKRAETTPPVGGLGAVKADPVPAQPDTGIGRWRNNTSPDIKPDQPAANPPPGGGFNIGGVNINPANPFGGLGMKPNNPQQSAATGLMGNPVGTGIGLANSWAARSGLPFDDAYKMKAQVTQDRPPLSAFTPGLGSLQGPADSLLGLVQKGVRDNPAAFAGYAGGLARPLVEPLLQTPVGLPALAGLNGLLAGGESFAAADTYFRPLLKQVGL